jgi:hypothetical protein
MKTLELVTDYVEAAKYNKINAFWENFDWRKYEDTMAHVRLTSFLNDAENKLAANEETAIILFNNKHSGFRKALLSADNPIDFILNS